MKPGYLTTEFYVTILTNVLAVVSALFHKRLGLDVTKDAAVIAGVANAVYTLARSHTKANFFKNAVAASVGFTTEPASTTTEAATVPSEVTIQTPTTQPVTSVDPEAQGF
jgi:hypothetical protein